ncbi:PAS domain-containing protein [Streptomyces sp. NPDC060366]|uniref:PAS domain-containing protein n=1 Tax=Streptomyces sp. NPDC060366 TaxID=3347105 RepID=UPI00364EEC8B
MAPNHSGELGGEVDAALLDVLFTQTPVALLIVDAELRIQRVNTASGGMTIEGLVGQPVAKAINATDPEGVEAMARAVLNSGVPVFDRLVPGRPTAEPDTEHIYSISVFRLQDGNGDVLGAVISLIDVTEREQRQARGAVRDAARKKIGSSLDVITTCCELTDVAVPDFADTAMVDVLDTVIRGNEPPLGPQRRALLERQQPFRPRASHSCTAVTTARPAPSRRAARFPHSRSREGSSCTDLGGRMVFHLRQCTNRRSEHPCRIVR